MRRVPRTAEPTDASALAELFADVFDADPVWSAIAPDAEVRRRMITESFRADASNGGHQDFDVLRDENQRVIGALHFTAPGRESPTEAASSATTGGGDRENAQERLAPEQPSPRDPQWAESVQRGRDHDRAVHHFRPAEPHWYFRDLGTSPQWQGQGLGSTLLRSRLAIVDQDPLPVFLESTSPASRRLYERFGFRHVATVEEAPGGVAYVMIRPAQVV